MLPGDVIQVEGRAPIVELALERLGLEIASDAEDDLLEGSFVECVVTEKSSLALQDNPDWHPADLAQPDPQRDAGNHRPHRTDPA